jgi:hypothetical protein
MDSSQKRNRDRKQRQKREEKELRKKERAQQKLLPRVENLDLPGGDPDAHAGAELERSERPLQE